MSKIVAHYTIHEQTMALMPAYHSNYQTIALEQERTLFIRQTPMQLIQAACLEYGATYEGRKQAVIHKTGFQRKIPLPIDAGKNIYVFPTHATNDPDCSWIFATHVRNINPTTHLAEKAPSSKITFSNGAEILVDVPSSFLQKQMERTLICLSTFSLEVESDYLGVGK
ncbi:competence protein ComK [Oceanobacillus damuensis]|uniref:competence protein ComK n=1 Tax=Oceanobacillus damuensis TaxID=937928 RepID=UPI00082A2FCC|nr:competence protein ComK [Oceanobacillus damuensis]